MVLAQDTIKLVRSEYETLTEFLHHLSPEAWSLSTPCELWDVGDVVAHLVWVAEFYGDGITRGVHGDVSTPEGAPVPGALDGPSIDNYIAQRGISRRDELGDRLLPTFGEKLEWFVRLLEGLGPAELQRQCYHLTKIREVQEFTAMALQELTLHGWDIRSALEPAPQLSAVSLSELLRRIPERRRPWTIPFQTKTEQTVPLRFRFELTGTVPGDYDIIVDNDRARMEPSSGATPHVSIVCPSETFVVLIYGRLTLDSASSAGLATVKGDGELVSGFDQWLQGA